MCATIYVISGTISGTTTNRKLIANAISRRTAHGRPRRPGSLQMAMETIETKAHCIATLMKFGSAYLFAKTNAYTAYPRNTTAARYGGSRDDELACAPPATGSDAPPAAGPDASPAAGPAAASAAASAPGTGVKVKVPENDGTAIVISAHF